MAKRTDKLLYALQEYVSKDYVYRNIACIKFDLERQTIEVTDGHGAVVLHTSKGLIASLANQYAEYLGLDPVGGDFGVVKLAPKNGKTTYKGDEVKFCICQMPIFENSPTPHVEIRYDSLDELDRETMKEFMSIHR